MQKHLNPKPIWNPGPLPGNHPDKQKTSDTLPLALGCMPHWILGYSTNKQNYCQHRFLFLSFWATPLNTTNSWSKVFWPHVKVSSLWQGSNVKSQSWLSNWDSWGGKGLIHFLNCCSFCSELSGFCLNRHLLSYSWQTQYQHHPLLHLHHHRHHSRDHQNHNHHQPVQVFSKWQHSQLFMTKCMTVYFCQYSKKLQNLSCHICIGKYFQCWDDNEKKTNIVFFKTNIYRLIFLGSFM